MDARLEGSQLADNALGRTDVVLVIARSLHGTKTETASTSTQTNQAAGALAGSAGLARCIPCQNAALHLTVAFGARGRTPGRDIAIQSSRNLLQGGLPLPVTKYNPTELFPQYKCYSHAVEISGNSRLLVISGLNGYLADGTTMPESFEEQAEIIWGHIHTLLRSAGMDANNIVSLRTYLADPKYDEANVRMRVKHLGTCEPSSTVVCCQLLDPRWKLEIEAMAAAAV